VNHEGNATVTTAALLSNLPAIGCGAMKPLRLVLFVAVCVCATARANETFKIDPTRSAIAFKVRHMLGSAKGSFSKFAGTIEADRDHPEHSSVMVTIDAASIDTAIVKRDAHLRAELFNVAKYPEITFKSRRVKQTGANTGEIAGDLTMRGVTRALTLQVQLLSNSDALSKNPTSRWRVTTAPLRRSQFGLVFSKSAETVSMISDEVAVDIEIEARRSK
jgi:polyisoprenoid-binding protein YceI